MRKFALLVVLTVLAACSQNAMLDTVAAPADRQIATKLIADLSAGRDEDVLKALFPQLREQMRPVLPKCAPSFPPAGTVMFA